MINYSTRNRDGYCGIGEQYCVSSTCDMTLIEEILLNAKDFECLSQLKTAWLTVILPQRHSVVLPSPARRDAAQNLEFAALVLIVSYLAYSR